MPGTLPALIGRAGFPLPPRSSQRLPPSSGRRAAAAGLIAALLAPVKPEPPMGVDDWQNPPESQLVPRPRPSAPSAVAAKEKAKRTHRFRRTAQNEE